MKSRINQIWFSVVIRSTQLFLFDVSSPYLYSSVEPRRLVSKVPLEVVKPISQNVKAEKMNPSFTKYVHRRSSCVINKYVGCPIVDTHYSQWVNFDNRGGDRERPHRDHTHLLFMKHGLIYVRFSGQFRVLNASGPRGCYEHIKEMRIFLGSDKLSLWFFMM